MIDDHVEEVTHQFFRLLVTPFEIFRSNSNGV